VVLLVLFLLLVRIIGSVGGVDRVRSGLIASFDLRLGVERAKAMLALLVMLLMLLMLFLVGIINIISVVRRRCVSAQQHSESAALLDIGRLGLSNLLASFFFIMAASSDTTYEGHSALVKDEAIVRFTRQDKTKRGC
jgi:hypothetical protein